MKSIEKIIHFYLYSNLHIALCAVCLCLFSFLSLGIPVNSVYLLYIFFSTLLLYALHRAVGIHKTSEVEQKKRFKIIERFRIHIFIYAGIGFIGALYCFYFLENWIRYQLIIPGIVSLLYALPVLGGKRLRDLPYIKIFLIALVWSWIVFAIPYLSFYKIDAQFYLLFLERALFIFLITVPFDIRDIETDKMANVNTIVNRYGTAFAKILAYSCVCICALILLFGSFKNLIVIPEITTLFLSTILVIKSSAEKPDYYYTGFVDGLMMVPLIVYWFITMV